MTTTIGSVTLDEDMVWTDQYKDNRISASVSETIGAGVVVQEFSKSLVGRKITLESIEGYGFQKQSTVDALVNLAKIPETNYTLTIDYDGLSYTSSVRFRNEEENGAIQFEPIFVSEGLLPTTTYYQGKIFLETV